MKEKQEQQIEQGEQCLGAGVGAPGSAVGMQEVQDQGGWAQEHPVNLD